jgi:signal transduction histidine kinase
MGELSIYLDQIVAGIDQGGDGSLAMTQELADPRFAQPISGLYWQIQGPGQILRSRSLWDTELALPADELPHGTVHAHSIGGSGDVILIALERSVTLPPRLGGETVRVAVAVDRSEVTTATRALTADLLPYLALLAVFLMAAAYAQVAIGLRPLAMVRQQVGAIRKGTARRLGTAFPDEILPLATEVDALLDAREAQAEKARARAGDLAHGFKTPLQVLVGDIERLRAKGEHGIASEIEQVASVMQRHVDRELARSRTASGNVDARAQIGVVVEGVLAVLTRTPAGAELEWNVDVPPGLVGKIDSDDLAEAIGNLLENASRHASAKVAISARKEANRVVVTIADDGPGIPETRLEETLARGGRLDSLGSGAGLGLAIVRDIAKAWGGQLDLRTSPQGVRAEFSVPT